MVGDLDLLTVAPDLWHDTVNGDEAERFDYVLLSLYGHWPLVWNQSGTNPFFTDARVRKALMHALDRETFIETVARGQARQGISVFHPDTVWANPDLSPRRYDPELAASLLDEAGWTDSDGDGIRDREGRPFAFTLLMPVSTMELTRQIAVWQQDSWQKLGIEVEIERIEFQVFRKRRNAGDFDVASFYLGLTPDPDQVYDLFHSSAAESGWNFYGLDDARIDALLDAARATFEPERRLALYAELQEALYEEEPIGFTLMFKSPVLFDARLRGVVSTPIGIWNTSEGPRRWYWVTDGGE